MPGLGLRFTRIAGVQAFTHEGVDLMRSAFHPTNGALTDQTAVPAEREALSHLFAGAIGHAKNPGSHRTVNPTAIETAELIGLASYLLGIVETRASKNAATKAI